MISEDAEPVSDKINFTIVILYRFKLFCWEAKELDGQVFLVRERERHS